MNPPISKGTRKLDDKPVIITTNTIKPKISERTRRKRKEALANRYKASKVASGLTLCGIILLYCFLVLCVLIGIGGIVICGLYFNANSSTQIWKIVGIVLGAIVMIIGIILILLTILKQTRKRPWQYKKQKNISSYDNEYYSDDDDDDDDDDDAESIIVDDVEDPVTDSRTGQKSPEKMNASTSNDVSGNENSKTRDMALSPIGGTGIDPSQKSSSKDEMIYCPGCNRIHPTSHQCMYSTHIANNFGHQTRPIVRAAPQDSIAIQTEDDTEPKKKKKSGPHTLIDRKLKYSYNTETQTDVTAKPGTNVTESIILRRVPIPTAKVVVQQPTTKVMIVKVPNKTGQLVIQPKPSDSYDQKQ